MKHALTCGCSHAGPLRDSSTSASQYQVSPLRVDTPRLNQTGELNAAYCPSSISVSLQASSYVRTNAPTIRSTTCVALVSPGRQYLDARMVAARSLQCSGTSTIALCTTFPDVSVMLVSTVFILNSVINAPNRLCEAFLIRDDLALGFSLKRAHRHQCVPVIGICAWLV